MTLNREDIMLDPSWVAEQWPLILVLMSISITHMAKEAYHMVPLIYNFVNHLVKFDTSQLTII